MSIVLLGSTSGSVTLQEPAVAGTTVLSLPNTTGTLITTGSSGQSIPKAALPTGSVLQVVTNIASVNFSTSSTSYVDTGMSATITPTSSSSKILAMVSFNGFRINAGYLLTKLYRNTTDITTSYGTGFFGAGNSVSDYDGATVSFTLLDSPATTSSTTYRIYGRYDGGGTSVLYGPSGNYNSTGQLPNYSITLLEIAA